MNKIIFPFLTGTIVHYDKEINLEKFQTVAVFCIFKFKLLNGHPIFRIIGVERIA